MHEKRFHGSPEFLRDPQRLALLEVDRVMDLLLKGHPIHRVLDVGTGSGVFAEAFARYGLWVTAMDISEIMLTTARRMVPSVAFVQASMEALPFAHEAFDLVFFGHALHETDNLHRALAEAARCARRCVAALEWPYRAEPLGPPLAHRLKPEDVRSTALEVGFRDVEVLSLRHMVFYRFTKTPPNRSCWEATP